MTRHIAGVVLLTLALTGCSVFDRSMPDFGAMPPVAPELSGSAGVPTGTGASVPASSTTNTDMAAGGVMQELDALWASGKWDAVISLLEAEKETPESALSTEILLEKLYAAHINAGHAALRQESKEAAQEHFFAALAIAPERGEGNDGLQVVQRGYIDEARRLLDALEQKEQQQWEKLVQAEGPLAPEEE